MSGTVPLDDLTELVREWRAATQRSQRQRAIARRAEQVLRARLGDACEGTINGQPVVRRAERAKPRFDYDRFASEYPELAAQYSYQERRDSLKIPPRRQAGEQS